MNASNNNPYQNQGPPGSCHYCKKMGHFKANCPELQRIRQVKEVNYMDSYDSGPPNDFYKPMTPDNKLEHLREEIGQLSVEELSQLSSGGNTNDRQDFTSA